MYAAAFWQHRVSQAMFECAKSAKKMKFSNTVDSVNLKSRSILDVQDL